LIAFKKAVAHDTIIIETIEKILDHRVTETGPRPELLNDSNYPFKRAFLDGRAKEILWLKQLLSTDGDSDNE